MISFPRARDSKKQQDGECRMGLSEIRIECDGALKEGFCFGGILQIVPQQMPRSPLKHLPGPKAFRRLAPRKVALRGTDLRLYGCRYGGRDIILHLEQV